MAETLLDLGAVHQTWKKEVRSSRLVKSALGSARSGSRASSPATPRTPKRRKAPKRPADAAPAAAAPAAAAAADAAAPPPRLYAARGGAAAWAKTRAWRAAHDVDGALRDAAAARRVAPVKRLYPHYLHGRSPSGAVIFFELLGRLDTSVLASGEVDKAGIVRHFCLAHEWISRTFEGEDTRLVTVLDAGGLRWSEVNAAFLQLLGAASEVTESLVPYRTERVLVVNAPRWFSAVFGTVKSVLPRDVRDKVDVVAAADRAAALAALCGDALPPAYGGRGPALGDHAFERAFLRDAADVAAGAAAADGAAGADDAAAAPAVADAANAAGADDADDTDEFHECEGPPADEAEDGDVWHECESGIFEFFSDEDLSESDDDDRAPAAARVVEDRADDAAATMAAPARVVEDHFGDEAAQIRAAELRGLETVAAARAAARAEGDGAPPAMRKPATPPKKDWLTSLLFDA
ncbi:hypothetical protein AURANDRAFT_67644 [Aureococcus anophagefferens]|uniref:CRAL-TRIO domain-containing protein n=1 Tax=Aureococcus anophagefferens TaxID=44056 RepID=F0YLW9_AURAN|nr:hypothetical protein AURANDRAFT_67644 [Aureococcus anophagefferens]EGB03895.1 hypothetical protein AURANDRAFT_67644 [Aureococcus anophagefferens]|eukprot:XP_009041447.1 hypothetical protein AURANDRAFT_67644 [Aureococcus anophagefferens]